MLEELLDTIKIVRKLVVYIDFSKKEIDNFLIFKCPTTAT